jgi:hypothetical protein
LYLIKEIVYQCEGRSVVYLSQAETYVTFSIILLFTNRSQSSRRNSTCLHNQDLSWQTKTPARLDTYLLELMTALDDSSMLEGA